MIAWSVSISAQAGPNPHIEPLWVTGLTNTLVLFAPPPDSGLSTYRGPCTNYLAQAVVMDRQGNTLVGGYVVFVLTNSPGLFIDAPLVAKFDPHGSLLWLYWTGTNADAGVDGLDVDNQGNVFFSIHPDSTPQSGSLTLIKLSPTGKELWRIDRTGLFNQCNCPVSGVSVDRHSGAVLLETLEQEAANQCFFVVSKYDRCGRLLWKTPLPGTGACLWGEGRGLSEALQATPEGGALVLQAQNTAYISKLNAAGRLLWRRAQSRANGDSVRLSKDGLILTTGSGTGLLRPDGHELATFDVGLDFVPNAPGNAFLIWEGDYVEAISFAGKSAWTQHTGLPHSYVPGGAVSDPRGGWLVCGLTSSIAEVGLQFVYLNGRGHKAWRSPIWPLREVYSQPRNGFMRAADGTLRLVVNTQNNPQWRCGFQVLAFRER